jgi:acetyl-CoA acyltransferase
MREAVIVTGGRTAIGRAHKGALRQMRTDDLAGRVIQHLLLHQDKLEPSQVDDVVMGCAYPEGSQGNNTGRVIALRSGLPESVPGMTVNRLCASGLQAVAIAAQRILTGECDIVIAGGIESMSMIKRGGFNWDPNPHVMTHYPGVYMTMGLTAELLAQERGITREAMDEYAAGSHQKAAAAVDRGDFAAEIIPMTLEEGGTTVIFNEDEHLRRDTTFAALSGLKPVFRDDGVVTAGNASPLSDGAAALILMEGATAARLGFEPLARFVGFAVGGVRPDIMGIGPVAAVPRVLDATGLKQQDIDLVELNEAFAAQVLPVIHDLALDPAIVNVNGGALALGHPLGCTGAKLTLHLALEMPRRRARYGLVTMCIGGGMGAAGIFENLKR